MNPILLNAVVGILLSTSIFFLPPKNSQTVVETVNFEPISEMITDENIEDDVPSTDDIELLALITMAEAEGECEEGKRLVIDSVLNRVESKHYPDTIYDVIYQPTEFSSAWNGRIEICETNDYVRNLVIEEMENKYDENVIFFNADDYSEYGVPMFQVGNHYFSSYD